jgi:RimJ/RimL family protein N-acetyltransferase
MYAFFELLFGNWNLRKIYAEVPEYNLDVVWGAEQSLFEEEGRLREVEFLDGRWWDQSIGALSRDRWERFATAWGVWRLERV